MAIKPMKVLPRDTQALRETLPQRSDVWRSLDVSILQYAIFEGLLGLTLEKVSRSSGIAYLHDADEAKAAVDAGRYAAAFILRTAPLEAVTAVAAHREKMPPKSTFFYPKALTGMVIRAL